MQRRAINVHLIERYIFRQLFYQLLIEVARNKRSLNVCQLFLTSLENNKQRQADKMQVSINLQLDFFRAASPNKSVSINYQINVPAENAAFAEIKRLTDKFQNDEW